MNDLQYDALAAQARLAARDIQRIWEAASQYDNTLRVNSKQISALDKRRVEPQTFSRSSLFRGMSLCESRLFSNFPVQPRIRRADCRKFSIVEELAKGFPRSKRARVRVGANIEYLPVPHVVERWLRSKAVFGVTDLHYVGTRFDSRMDTSRLNDFNLLPRGADGFESQDSLVISSKGAFTDSHSDDHSGSNHSFTGVKLWLLWDTTEGFQHGLEDVERCDVYDQAKFDMSAFLAMDSSCWILIGPGQTMFIPAHLTHKVITLTPYLGLGSFHAGLPGFVDLLVRWSHLPPTWAAKSGGDKRRSVEFITRRAIRKIHSLKNASKSERFKWGVPYLRERIRQTDNRQEIRKLGHDYTRNLEAFVQAARSI
jgi:hypothetical protein